MARSDFMDTTDVPYIENHYRILTDKQHRAVLDGAALKNGLKYLWFATGKDDLLVETSRPSVAMLKKHGLDAVYQETEDAHTWINWRRYLHEFAQTLFK